MNEMNIFRYFPIYKIIFVITYPRSTDEKQNENKITKYS